MTTIPVRAPRAALVFQAHDAPVPMAPDDATPLGARELAQIAARARAVRRELDANGAGWDALEGNALSSRPRRTLAARILTPDRARHLLLEVEELSRATFGRQLANGFRDLVVASGLGLDLMLAELRSWVDYWDSRDECVALEREARTPPVDQVAVPIELHKPRPQAALDRIVESLTALPGAPARGSLRCALI